jgi:hypothetical protein
VLILKLVNFGHANEQCKVFMANLVNDDRSILMQKNEDQEIFDVLRVWLQDSKAPKPCDLESCGEKVDNYNKFCSTHQCQLVGCNELKTRGDFCDSHLCQYEIQCFGHKFSHTEYCKEHVCVSCLMEKSANVQSKLNKNKSCKKHTCHFGGVCEHTSVFPYHYCETHLCFSCAEMGDDLNSFEKNDYALVTNVYTGPKDPSINKHKFMDWPKIFGKNNCAYHTCRQSQCRGRRLPKSYDNVCLGHFVDLFEAFSVQPWYDYLSSSIPKGAFKFYICDDNMCENKIYSSKQVANNWFCPLHEKQYPIENCKLQCEHLDTSLVDDLEEDNEDDEERERHLGEWVRS